MAFFDYKNIEDFKEQCGYEIDGRWYPRVTKIVGIKSKPALYRFYGAAESYESAKAMTEKSAEEGTLLHEVVQDIMIGNSPEIPELIRPAVEEYKKFADLKGIQIDPKFIEKRIYSPSRRYAGTIDAIAVIDGKVGVLDIKTSQAIYRDYNLQTAAYMDALSPSIPKLETRWILRIDQNKKCLKCQATLRPKGGREKIKRSRITPCKDEHKWSDLQGIVELQEFPFWKDDFRAFLAAKFLWEWENDYWLKKINYFNN
ncbi:hypothetical protein GW950_01655 [Candidatus Wolfebacteria bacterium]|nr:hypothetical protein [Candidatus Wolfebacteria bacterium]